MLVSFFAPMNVDVALIACIVMSGIGAILLGCSLWQLLRKNHRTEIGILLFVASTVAFYGARHAKRSHEAMIGVSGSSLMESFWVLLACLLLIGLLISPPSFRFFDIKHRHRMNDNDF
jgi:uncharacterized membrane protein